MRTSLDDIADKPALARALARKHSPEMIELFGAEELDPFSSEETIRRRAEMMLAVDEGLGRIVTALDSRGLLDDTFILFTSDNGFFYGEHGLSVERRLPYEESIRTPMVVRYPRVAQAGSEISNLVASVDIAPTILEIAGAPIGDHIQGRSFVPLLLGHAHEWRESLLIEFYTYENPFPWLLDMDYRAIRTRDFKLIHWMQYPEEGELYDLREDPYETRNVIAEPRYAGTLNGLRAEMATGVLDALGLNR